MILPVATKKKKKEQHFALTVKKIPYFYPGFSLRTEFLANQIVVVNMTQKRVSWSKQNKSWSIFQEVRDCQRLDPWGLNPDGGLLNVLRDPLS